jgi:hypothetical protein
MHCNIHRHWFQDSFTSGGARFRRTKALNEKLWPVTVLPVQHHHVDSIPPNFTNNSVGHLIRRQLNAEFVSFCHAALGSPPISTLTKAIRLGYLDIWPELTLQRV